MAKRFFSQLLDRCEAKAEQLKSRWAGLSDHGQVGVCLTGVTGVLALWALFWPVPTEVKGQGVLIFPSKAGLLNARAQGQVLAVNVKVGDRVKKGQELMSLYLPVLERELAQQRGNLLQLEAINSELNERDARRLETEKAAVDVALAKFDDDLDRYSRLQATYGNKLNNLEWLSARQVVAPLSREVVSAEQGLTNTSVSLDDVTIQRKRVLTAYQQVKLDIETEALDRQFAIGDLKRKISVTEAQIAYDGKVLAGREGVMIDLQVIPGQTVKVSDRLGTILGSSEARDNKAPQLNAVAYFKPADARRLPLGLPVEVVPDWQQRGRFGGIVGKVTSVLTLPSTEDDVSTTTGNPQLAKELTKDGPVMRAEIELVRSKGSMDGYRWTLSLGSGVFPIREGLTTTTHAYVEWRSPLSYVIPGLRSLTGGFRTLRIDRLWNRPFLVQPDTIE